MYAHTNADIAWYMPRYASSCPPGTALAVAIRSFMLLACASTTPSL